MNRVFPPTNPKMQPLVAALKLCNPATNWLLWQDSLEEAYNVCTNTMWLLQALEHLECIPTWTPETIAFARLIYYSMVPVENVPHVCCKRVIEAMEVYQHPDEETNLRQLTLAVQEMQRKVAWQFEKHAWQMWAFKAYDYYNIRTLASNAIFAHTAYKQEIDIYVEYPRKQYESFLCAAIREHYPWSTIAAACQNNPVIAAVLP